MSDDKVLRIERVLDAPRERVFEAWTRPEMLAAWWGGWAEGQAPEFTCEPRAGGRWRFAMSFDGGTSWNGGEYTEVVPPRRLAFTFAWEGPENPPTPVVVELEDLGDGRTRLVLTHDLSAGPNACVEGWDAQLGPLERYLEKVSGTFSPPGQGPA